ncbi:MAG: hypothetical protein R3E02_03135 [Blastomonas sp.]
MAHKHSSSTKNDKVYMRFRLTYAGPLLGASKTNPRASHKRDIRMAFHPQLKHLWEQTSFLKDRKTDPEKPFDALSPNNHINLQDFLANNFMIDGIGFVPLVTERWQLHCSLDILFLRPGRSGSIVSGGDLDNRLKTLFDALRRPLNKQEMGGGTRELDGERVFCLLEDDSLIDSVSLETGDLLEPLNKQFRPNDVRLVITVNVLPYQATMGNLDFIGRP